MIRVLIADIDSFSRSMLRSYLSEAQGVSIVAECTDGLDARRKIAVFKPDVFIIDTDLPKISGFEIFKFKTDTKTPYIIFTSACDKYAVRAFEFHAVDYLIKPFRKQRFLDTLTRVKDDIERDKHHHLNLNSYLTTRNSSGIQPSVERIPIKIGRRIRLLDTSAIHYITADRDFTNLHMATGETIHTSERISQLERKLLTYNFQRIQRSRILNLKHVREILPRNTQYEFVMCSGECFMSGILYKRELDALIATWNKHQQAA